MPASMIRAPTGGRPKVMGSSIATVAMVPMPGSTPTSVPTSAPIRHSSRLIGVRATPKPRARLEKSSNITPSLDQEAREKLQRQPQRIREKQTAADGQADADDDGFLPADIHRAKRRDHEAGKGRYHQPQRANGDREGNNGKRDEQRAAPGVGRQFRALGYEADDRDSEAEAKQQHREHAGRGAGSERKSMHALQIARCPQGKQRDRHQRYAAEEILRSTNPFGHDGFDRPMARRFTHKSLSPRRA